MRYQESLPIKKRYIEIIGGIRKYAPKLVICVSLSGRDFGELEKRSDPLLLEGDLKPDMGSLTLSSLSFNKTASVNTPEMVADLARIMKEKGIVSELKSFDIGNEQLKMNSLAIAVGGAYVLVLRIIYGLIQLGESWRQIVIF